MARKRNRSKWKRAKRAEAKRARRPAAPSGRSASRNDQASSRPPAPIDLIKIHLTAGLVLGQSLGRTWAEENLAKLNLRAAMTGLAHLLARRQDVGVTQAQADVEVLAACTPGLKEAIERARRAYPHSVVLDPRACLLAMRIALRVCPEEGGIETNGLLVLILLALQDELDAPDGPQIADPTDPQHRLFREIVRSHAFSSSWNPRSRMAHFDLRWRDFPTRLGIAGRTNPAEAFQDATGIDLTDFVGLGTAFWAGSISHPGQIVRFPAGIAWDEDRRERTLGPMTSRVADMRQAVSQVVGEDEAYAFDEFRRWPILRFGDDEYLVLAPHLLFERLSGAPPLLDIRAVLPKVEAERVMGTARAMCEFDALEAVQRMCEVEGFTYYSEQELRTAFGRTGVPIAEAAVDTGDEWIVFEVSSRTLSRPTLIDADAEALRTDLDRGIRQKFRQVNSIVSQLIDREEQLTGVPAVDRKRHTRVLVAYDGFPLNPLTYEAIQGVSAHGRAETTISPAHVIDAEELDLLESMVERRQSSLPRILLDHERASLRRAAFKDYVLVELGLEPPFPKRLMPASDQSGSRRFARSEWSRQAQKTSSRVCGDDHLRRSHAADTDLLGRQAFGHRGNRHYSVMAFGSDALPDPKGDSGIRGPGKAMI